MTKSTKKSAKQSVKKFGQKPTRKAHLKPQQKPKEPASGPPDALQAECPYRFPGTLYGTLFTEGNKDYIAKDALLKKVAELTGKSEKVVGFAYQVLKSPSHRSNGKRSTIITEGDKIKIIALKNSATT